MSLEEIFNVVLYIVFISWENQVQEASPPWTIDIEAFDNDSEDEFWAFS